MTVFVRPGQKLCPLTGRENPMTNKLTACGEIEIKGSLRRNWGKFTEIATYSGPPVPFLTSSVGWLSDVSAPTDGKKTTTHLSSVVNGAHVRVCA